MAVAKFVLRRAYHEKTILEWALAKIRPTTQGGVIALLSYVDEREANAGDWPDADERQGPYTWKAELNRTVVSALRAIAGVAA